MAWGKTLDELNQKVRQMMEKCQGGLDWSCMHQCNFVIEKFGVMGLTRWREQNRGGRTHTRPMTRKPNLPVRHQNPISPLTQVPRSNTCPKNCGGRSLCHYFPAEGNQVGGAIAAAGKAIKRHIS